MSINKSKKVFFLRHGKLDLPYKNHAGMPFHVLNDLSQGKINPGINLHNKESIVKLKNFIDFSSIDTIFYNNEKSTFRRAFETATLLASEVENIGNKTLSIKGTELLHEIFFDMNDIVTENEFLVGGMDLLRKNLYASVLEGRNVESINQACLRIDNFFALLNSETNREKSVVAVSHNFFMRIVQAYFLADCEVNNVTLDSILNTPVNNYFSGFSIDTVSKKVHTLEVDL